MKNIDIPNGWRRLKRSEYIQKGDKYNSDARSRWRLSVMDGESVSFMMMVGNNTVYIRKIKPKAKK